MSNDPPRTSGRRYALTALSLIVAGLAAAEWFIRDSVEASATMKPGQEFVLKLLTADGSDIVAGDSHVGVEERLAAYAFFGLAGAAPPELERALRVYFRFRPVGRVMIEVGPQQVSAKRQVEWRTLAKHSLVRQVLPFDVYLFEPELISLAEQRVAHVLPWKPAATSSGKAAARGKGARKRSPEALARRKSAAYAALPEAVRRERIPIHAARQRPVRDFRNGPAWQAQERVIRWLVARGGNVCLIRTPVTREYEEWLAAPKAGRNYARHRRVVKALAKELRVPYIDYLDLGLGNLPVENFRNPDHLNDAGHRVYWPAVEKACFPDT